MAKKPLITLCFTAALSLTGLQVQGASLADIYQLALQNDPQLKADRAALGAGQQARKIGRSALLPQISASGDYSKRDTNVEDQLPGNPFGNDSNQEQGVWSATLSQPLFNMAAWYGYKQGQAISQQAEAQFLADQQALIVRVATAYFNVLRATDNLETALAEEKALSHQLEQTKQRFEVGLTAITDVYESQAAFDTAAASTLETRGNLGIAFEALEVLTGQSHTEVDPLQSSFVATKPTPLDRHEWVNFALQNNYNLKVSRLAAEAARLNGRVKASGHYPVLTASASYSDSEEDGNNSFSDFDTESENEVYAINLTLPLYSGGRISAEKQQAHQEHMRAQELLNKTQRDVIQATRSLHLSVLTDVPQVKARQQAVKSSKSAVDATQAGYEVGTRNLVDVLVAQRTLYQARRNYSTALYDYIISMFALKEVAGNLSGEDIDKLNESLDADKPVNLSKYQLTK